MYGLLRALDNDLNSISLSLTLASLHEVITEQENNGYVVFKCYLQRPAGK
jgi:hypothetical protein